MEPTVLVVDDSTTVCADLRYALVAAGFAVTLCGTRAAARSELRKQAFAAIILDVNLPDGDGIDLLGEIKADPSLGRTPVLLLSKLSEVAARVRGMALGADAYVGKPYDRTYIVQRIYELASPKDAHVPGYAKRWSDSQKILMIDSGTMSAHLLRDGHEVVVARSCMEMLDLLRVDSVDCVILDRELLGEAGPALCRRVKELLGAKRTAVFALMSSDDPGAQGEWLAAGADQAVIKSPSFTILRIRLRALARVKQSRRQSDLLQDEGSGEIGSGPRERPLLDRVVSASGLPPVIAWNVMEAACRRAGVPGRGMTRADLSRALPSIQQSLGVLLPVAEAVQRMEVIAAFVKEAAGTTDDVEAGGRKAK